MAKTRKRTYFIKIGLAEMLCKINITQSQFAIVAGIANSYLSGVLQQKIKIGTAARAGVLVACKHFFGREFEFDEMFEEAKGLEVYE